MTSSEAMTGLGTGEVVVLGSEGGAREDTAGQAAGRRYLHRAVALVESLLDESWDDITRAAEMIAASLLAGGSLHAFGSGHGHMLAEEAFYRAGGLVAVKPILFDGLMLHSGAQRSTAMERLPGLAEVLLVGHPMRRGDVLLVASNSGGNAATVEMAQAAKARGVGVVAITSLGHARSPLARATSGPRLHEVADVVIDNGGAPGDAVVDIAGAPHRVGPTSTVVGAAAVNAIVAEVVERMTAAGLPPAVYASANLAGGDSINAAAEVAEREVAERAELSVPADLADPHGADLYGAGEEVGR